MSGGAGWQGEEPGQWTFWRRRDGCWHWRQTGLRGASRVSRAGHQGLDDCMANAMYHGYVPPSQGAGESVTAG